MHQKQWVVNTTKKAFCTVFITHLCEKYLLFRTGLSCNLFC